MHIRIISTPPGEAPEQVRAAWIGLTLPLLVAGAHVTETVGVLSGPTTRFGLFFARLFGRVRRERGYFVDAHQAVELLATHAPDAARWWRESAARAVQPGSVFVFHCEVCQEVTT
jgi:hypothetical protein